MRLVRQGLSFVAIGGCLVAIDWFVFVALTALGVGPIAANLAGRMVGAVLGFWANGRITFGDTNAPRVGYRRFVRYVLLWLSLTFVSTSLMILCAEYLGLQLTWLAKPMVEVVLALVSFFVSRHWVYR
jgi:putative flippase GtrA